MAELPIAVTAWLERLRRLEGVPFNYLVADPALVPPESIRFFYLDQSWLDALVDGAFSLGRATAGDQAAAGGGATLAAPLATPQVVTGFLLRSQVVVGWPGLEVAAYAAGSTTALDLLRFVRLAPDTLLCLFDGELARVDLHEPPEGLHFGLDLPDDGSLDPSRLRKELKALSDPGAGATNGKIVPAPFRPSGRGVLDVGALAASMRAALAAPTFTSAELALEMVEGVGRVTFVASGGAHG